MGEVYRARDTRLDRDVAVKVLPEATARDPQALARFEREAKAVAALSHPNILAVFDVGRHEDISYVVLELLEGETLRSRIDRSALSPRKAVELGIEIAEGLSAAHAKGVIHRDLKPENIFLTADGQVKILDFGLARSTGAGQGTVHDLASSPTLTIETRPGAIIGTLCYMAPEQIRALPTDARTDIFAFGCVMYEMLTGRRAFLGETAADTMTAILKDEPAGVRSSASGVGLELERLIDRCLEKRPERRFQSAADLAFSLRSLLSHSESPPPPTVRRSFRPGRAVLACIVIAAVLAGAGFVRRELRQARRHSAADAGSRTSARLSDAPATARSMRETPTLAVLPFANDSGDAELDYLTDGITETLINGFSRLEGLKVIPRSTVFRHKNRLDEPAELGRDLSATAVLTGRVLKRADSLTVQAELVSVTESRQLWGERYQRKFEDLVQIERDIAADITDALRLRLTGEEKRKISRGYSENAEAYRLYLQGRFWWSKRTKEGFDNALRLLDQAVQIDPTFALAHSGIADTYVLLPLQGYLAPADALVKARDAAERALRLDDQLAEAHTSMGMVRFYLEWDLKRGEQDFQRAMKLNPRYATAHQWYALNAGIQGRMAEARAELLRAIELDPLAPIFFHNLGWIAHWERDWNEMLSRMRAGLQFAPEFPLLHHGAGLALLELDQTDEALAHMRKSLELAPSFALAACNLGYGLARAGHETETRALLADWLALSRSRYVPPSMIATIYVGLGEPGEAFSWLEKAYEARDTWMVFLGVMPQWDPLRSDPRFDDLLRRVGLPTDSGPDKHREATTSPLDGGREATASPFNKGGHWGVTGGRIMLVVLPFENLSRDPEQDYFSDGLTEEMITQLGRVNPQKLGVIARSSAMHYKNTDRTIPHIKEELGVDYVVEGSVRRHEDEIRITARLVDTTSQSQIWADSFAPEVKNLLTWQNNVAQTIAREISVTLHPQEQARMVEARPINPEAYEAYLKGRFYLEKRTPESSERAAECFEQAMKLEPAWPQGYLGFAELHLFVPAFGYMRPSEAIPKARAAAAKAVELDGSLGEGHAALAQIATIYDWDWPVAERKFQQALTLSPNSARARQWYATLHMRLSRYEEATQEAGRSRELDPLSPEISNMVGVVAYYAGDFAQAETRFRKTLELAPTFPIARAELARALLAQGKFVEAMNEAREAVRLSGNDPWCMAMLGYAAAKSGRPEVSRRILEELTTRLNDAYVAPALFAVLHAGLDEVELAFDWLEKAYRERDPLLVGTLKAQLFANLRTDPRFIDLMRRVGLPPPARMPSTAPQPPPLQRGDKGGLADGRIMLAVLPFENLSRDPEQDYFSDGLTEEMIGQLGRINPQKLGVIARTSAMRYKNADRTITDIARELGVGYVLEGSVRRTADRVRISAKLIQAGDQTQMWSQDFDRTLEDIFAVQKEVAEHVARRMAVELLPGERALLSRAPTRHAAAHEAYLRGLFAWNQFTPEDWRKALSHFNEAVELDPKYAAAHAGLAMTYNVLAASFLEPPRETFAKARAASQTALQLDPQLADAHASLAATALFSDRNGATVERHLKDAFDVNPDSGRAHEIHAFYLLSQGKTKDAIEAASRGQRLDPLSFITTADVAFAYYNDRDYPRAIEQCEKVLSLSPDFYWARALRALAWNEQGRYNEVISDLAGTDAMDERVPALVRAQASAGQRDAALRATDALVDRTGSTRVDPAFIAMCHLGLGDVGRAFEWLDKAADEPATWWLLFLRTAPVFDPLRADPRFEALVQKIGLKE